MQRIINALKVLFGLAVVLDTEIETLINNIYEKVEPNPMTQDTKDKLAAVLAYVTKLPDKFKKLQDEIDSLKSNDQADADKISALTSEVDTLKADNDEVVASVEALDAAAKAADQADGPEGEPTP